MRWLWVAALALVAWPVHALADDLLIADLQWLAIDANDATPLLFEPGDPVNPHAPASDEFWYFELGRLAFRSPALLGGLGGRHGLSCNSCHSSGGVNSHFFVDGLSDFPGTFDTTNALFSTHTDDGVFNPKPIPPLFGVAETAPYPADGRFATLEQIVDHVVLKEFDGLTPPVTVHRALLHYLKTIEPPDNAQDTPLTAEFALNDLRRLTKVLSWSTLTQNPETVVFTVNAIRRQLEAVHNRFSGVKPVQAELSAWSLELRTVRRLIDAEDRPGARAAAEAVLQRMETRAADIIPWQRKSLYDPTELATYLESRTASEAR